jgi:sterol desaturase/sphingolipid hydroxylase (fatty acid hydroxylase superfamily)
MWISDQTRVLALVAASAVLWSLESAWPLYRYETNRWRRALPNIALTVLLVLTNLVLSFLVAAVSSFSTTHKPGFFQLLNMPLWLTAISGVVALDLFTYFAHVLMHKSWIGWQFHRVHHSDNEVNVTTAFRQHPGETLWRILWQVLAVAIFRIPFSVFLAYLTISTLNAQLEHTNIRVTASIDRVLRLLIVTPNMHKIHHSREQNQTDTNYSNIFSFWDRLFGTYSHDVNWSGLRYGLAGFDEENRQTFVALLKTPFIKWL